MTIERIIEEIEDLGGVIYNIHFCRAGEYLELNGKRLYIKTIYRNILS